MIEKVGRPWVGKKLKEYMGGVEEQQLVSMIIKYLNARILPKQMKSKVESFLDEEAEEFVMKLWQALIFENMKVDEGLYK